MVVKSKEPSEADIISNRINVRHADKLRLIASWLPAPTKEELSSAKTQEELEQEEKEMFAPVPELLGVGAQPPKDLGEGILKRKDTSSLEALRKQLLGKHAKRQQQPVKGSLQGPGSALVDRTAKEPVDEDSDDEGGRTAAFTSRNQRSQGQKSNKKPKTDSEAANEAKVDDNSEDEDAQLKGSSSRPAAPTPSKRKASSYLDELLAEKSKKKKQKQKKGQGDTKA